MEPELYSSEELEILEEHIGSKMGKFPTVIHELLSPDIHLDIAVIPPNEEHNFYTLVTMGMGAHKMDVPEELRNEKLDRAELIICLPPDWDIDSSENRYYWPVRLLKFLARLPIGEKNWLGWGHSIDLGENVDENCGFSAALLLLTPFGEDADICTLPDGDEVNFYLVMPLYRKEMQYKIKNGTDALLELFGDELSPVVDTIRPDVATQSPMTVMDTMEWHVGTIREKKLPVDELSGYNHMAIYLRWCIEKGLMCREFEQSFQGITKKLRAGDSNVPLRELIKVGLGGKLYREIFNDEGQRFAEFYYDHGNQKHCYPADVDRFAMRYFGMERYYSEEFQDEAYLFIPYDEGYYQGMKQFIDIHYKMFKDA